MFKMVKIGDVHRIIYAAKNFTTGLTDVTGKAISPSGGVTNIPWSGSDPTAGFCELAQGLYYYDWDSTGKSAGMWSFKADSASKAAPSADAIQVVDGDTLNDTPFEKLDTMIDAVKSAVENATYGLSAIHDDLAVVDGNVDDIETLASGSDGFSAIKTVVDAIQSAVGQISNSTKNTWVTSAEVVIPDTGSITRRIYMNVFNGDGALEDPDSNQIRVQVYLMDGTDVTTTYLTGVEPIYMTRDAAGQYHIDYSVASTDTAHPLMFKHTYAENSVTVVRQGVVDLLTSESGDIGAKLDQIIDDIEDATTGLAAIHDDVATVDGKVDDVKTVVDGIQTDLDNATDGLGAIKGAVDTANSTLGNATYGLSAIHDDVAAAKTVVDAIKAVTDNLPDGGALTSIAQEATLGEPAGASVSADIAAVKSVVDSISASLAPGGYIV